MLSFIQSEFTMLGLYRQLIKQGVFVREFTGGLFRVDQFGVNDDLKDTTPGSDQGYFSVQCFLHFVRQTGGTGLVVSLGAIFD